MSQPGGFRWTSMCPKQSVRHMFLETVRLPCLKLRQQNGFRTQTSASHACSGRRIRCLQVEKNTDQRCKRGWNAAICNQSHDLKIKLMKNSDPGCGKGVANLLNLLNVDTFRFR